MEKTKDIYKFSRVMYIIEAALEYFIAKIIAGAYIAKVTNEIGISDNITGILTSFVSLGCGFQVIAIFLSNKRPFKPWVTVLHTLNQLFFALIYVVPLLNFSKTEKTILFIIFLLLGHIINNVVNSPKINWYMSLVDNNKRGKFTANKEIISLLSGMFFSFGMGSMMDKFEAEGNIKGAFIFCGLGIFGLTVLHTLTLLFSKEKPVEKTESKSAWKMLRDVICNKNLVKIILISIIWNIAHYISTPFYGTYTTKDLGFSMTFISIVSAAYAVCRSLFSRPLGKYADKHSFANMLNICFAVSHLAFLVFSFAVPENGKVMYLLYELLMSIAMAGINSATINLIFDYVDKDKRVGALALKSTLAGFAGFFTTLAISPLFNYIQENGNKFLGLNMYPQQVLSAISASIVLLLILYLNLVVRKIKRADTEE